MSRQVEVPLNGRLRPPRIVPKDVQDGIADLRDYCTDPTTNATTSVAGEAISGLYRLYHLNETDKVKQAYSALHRLKQRNSDTFGDDIPIGHQTVYKPFKHVVDSLIDAIERDHHQELKKQFGARRR